MRKFYGKIIIATISLSILLCGCGGSSSASSKATYDAGAAYADYGAYDDSEMYMANAVAEEAIYDEEYEVDTSLENGATVTTVTFAEGKKIIYQSNVIMETMTYDETYSRLLELINKYEGYIEYENFENELRSYLQDNSGRGKLVISTNNLTIRIPSKNYSSFMQEGLTLGNVLNRNQSIEDKTSEYNTNKSYVDILNDEAEYLDKQLTVLENELKEAQANDKHYDEIIENMKDIAERKAQVELELVPYKRTMDDIDERVEYSTINMELREVNEFTILEKEVVEETFGSKLAETWRIAMEDLLDMLQGILLFLIKAIPVIVFLAILGGVVYLIIFLVKKSRKKKGVKKTSKKTAPVAPIAPQNPQMRFDPETGAPLDSALQNQNPQVDNKTE